MAIPPFDGILNVLPPHLGDPREPSHVAPYLCTLAEICERFATSPARKKILAGLLTLRREMFTLGIRGFQWIDGSFVENVEIQLGRDPGDIDVMTYVDAPSAPSGLFGLLATRPDIYDSETAKLTYFVDHYVISLGTSPIALVKNATYWYGLFSHRRGDGIWKGMLVAEMTNQAADDAARTLLEGMP